ncbi:LytTR family DNA-binding domain-containing protein [Mucilaginibacter sp. KACC 22773]|uniref:LytR/AlgR family response regulator transcription factor n=1 Tax=Mucilaginibacter sp. KACC 22773 TaxID=3025671 RepID=UPI002367389C|nr:LytTR family DNA-binding domain-containing protein [Mucilaginibacter sp. KACC 22773]WDF80756.1 LytTR family DNA-binding domain-containing protein [Mucilaginibacter sp. KACC 22773]
MTPELELVGATTDPAGVLSSLSGDTAPMLLLVDVDMPGISGLELAGLVNSETSIIFITSYREFGVEAFELKAIDYLLKPVAYARFYKAIQKVMAERQGKHNVVKERASFFVKGDAKEKYIKVVIDEIIYIVAALNYIEIHLVAGKVLTYLTLAEILAELPPVGFCQVHRSYIVNLKQVSAIEKSQVRLHNDRAIPIGKAYEAAFMKRLAPEFLISKRLSDN